MLAALICASVARPTGGSALSVPERAADFEAPAAPNPCTQGILPMDAPGPGTKRGRVALYPRVAYPPIPSVTRPLGLKFGRVSDPAGQVRVTDAANSGNWSKPGGCCKSQGALPRGYKTEKSLKLPSLSNLIIPISNSGMAKQASPHTAR